MNIMYYVGFFFFQLLIIDIQKNQVIVFVEVSQEYELCIVVNVQKYNWIKQVFLINFKYFKLRIC